MSKILQSQFGDLSRKELAAVRQGYRYTTVSLQSWTPDCVNNQNVGAQMNPHSGSFQKKETLKQCSLIPTSQITCKVCSSLSFSYCNLVWPSGRTDDFVKYYNMEWRWSCNYWPAYGFSQPFSQYSVHADHAPRLYWNFGNTEGERADTNKDGRIEGYRNTKPLPVQTVQYFLWFKLPPLDPPLHNYAVLQTGRLDRQTVVLERAIWESCPDSVRSNVVFGTRTRVE